MHRSPHLLLPLITIGSLCTSELPFQARLPVALAQNQQLDAESATQLFEAGEESYNQGDYQTALENWQAALAAYSQQADTYGEAKTLNRLGKLYTFCGECGSRDQALQYFEQSLAIAEANQHESIQGESLLDIGFLQATRNDHEGALIYYQLALERFEAAGDLRGQGDVFINMGGAYESLGQFDAALQHYEWALDIHRDIGNRISEASALNNMGFLFARQGQQELALRYYQQALTIRQELGNRAKAGETLNNIGGIYEQLNQDNQALEYFLQALDIHQEVGNLSAAAPTLTSIGLIYSRQEDYATALPFLHDALAAYEILERPGASAQVMNNLGFAYAQLGEFRQALNYHNHAFEVAQDSADQNLLEETLVLLGGTTVSLGEYDQALNYLQQALALNPQTQNQELKAAALRALGKVYARQGEQQIALDYYQQAVAIQRALGSLHEVGEILAQISEAHAFLGDYGEAFTTLQRALTIHQEAGDRGSEASTLGAIGLLHSRLGKHQDALKFHQSALAIQKEIHDLRGQANTFSMMAGAHLNLGDVSEASNLFLRSLDLNRTTGDTSSEAATLAHLGFLKAVQEEYDEALSYYQQSLEIREALGELSGAADVLSGMGGIYFSQREYNLASNYYHQALAIHQSLGNVAATAVVYQNLGFLQESLDRPELAIIFLKEAINTYEKIRAANRSLELELQDAYTNSVAEIYRHLANLLLQQDRILEAQQVLDLLRVQELEDYVRELRGADDSLRSINLRQDEQAILEQFKTVKNTIVALGQEQAGLNQIPREQRTPDQQSRIIELRRLEEAALLAFQVWYEQPEIVDLVNRLRSTLGATNIELAELNGLRDNLKRLNQNAVVLYPLVLEDRLELVLVTPYNPPIHRTVEVTRLELNRAIEALLYALVAPGRDAVTPAQQLYDWLIRPIQSDLQQAAAATILYSPDLRLRYIPLAALHDGEHWLVQTYRINNITAASLDDLNNVPTRGEISVLAAAFTEGTHEVVIGSRSIPYRGLAHAGPEIDLLANLIPTTEIRLNKAFNPNIIYEMDDFQIIHLATHASFVPGSMENSYILFGNGEFATLADVRRWNFPNVELVVLSACQTAVSDALRAEVTIDTGEDSNSINGEEILGFGYLMQAAGADAAIGSLWKVDDSGTQVLMNAFYEALSRGGLSKTAALQQAQLELIRLGTNEERGSLVPILANSDLATNPEVLSHPYYWAPFILIGNGL